MLEKFKAKIEKILNENRTNKEVDFDNQKLNVSQSQYLVTRAVVPDIPDILALKRVVCNSETIWTADAFEEAFQNREHKLYLVIRYEDQLVGFISCAFDRCAKTAHIMDLAVIPDYQKHGIARKLIEIVLLKAGSLKMVEVTATIAAYKDQIISIYTDLGFQIIPNDEEEYTYLKYEINQVK
ncbi:GNAT family N-acetyltransferase [Ligilactobacillus ceti]|uniref:N-acetyltransferase domain-containing protein n=1 Tax=Ligilactobacillus ceti DSM 22408 TaxID=1122146 RepID=A0A0R2KKY1_9LACO|nr:GNAT family N-acetyltransferase [Ligilactobacillus ceti]KRN88422.1 hypothetical protein IV53_GL000386 [Ligilactobacillus ceti DSM 22408]